jgi:hypothetical protein
VPFVARLLAVAIGLRVWHMLLLRQHQDEPAIVALWLLAGLGASAVAFRLSRAQIVFGGALVALLFVFHWGFERAASDGREYFVQVRSLVFDRDLDFANDSAVLGARGMARMYPFGVALLWAPFMLLAHAWLLILNLFGAGHGVDGFTNPYQRAIGIGTLLYGFAGVVLGWRIVRDYFGSKLASISVAAVVAGTFIVWYVVVENSMSHGASMFSATLFLYVWHRGRSGGGGLLAPAARTWWWVLFGLTAGLMMLVRWQNVLIAVVPAVEMLWRSRQFGTPFVRSAALAGAGAFAGFLPQLVFWKIVRGAWISFPAGEHGWNPASLHIADILLSSNHGLFSITPLALVGIAGLPFVFRRDPIFTLALVAGFAGQVVANSASNDWWGGPGFGARRFDNCLVAFAIGLSGLLVWLRSRPLAAPLAALGLFVAVNTLLMIDVRRGALPAADAITFEDVSRSVYRRLGNPFVWPYAAYIGSKYDADWSLYDRLRGRTFNNIDIDFGDGYDAMFLGNGWQSDEQTPEGTFRWAASPRASVVVPLKTADRYELEFAAAPSAAAGQAPQAVRILVNHELVRQLDLTTGIGPYVVAIPAAALRAGFNLIQFESDAAVRFDTLRLRRKMNDGS